MDSSKKRITIIKLIIIFFLFVITYFMFFSAPLSRWVPVNTLNSQSEPSKFAVIYLPINYFFNYLNNGEYNKAFDLLSAYTKENVFNNDINTFSSIMKDKYINNDFALKRQQYSLINEYKNSDGLKVYNLNCKIYVYKYIDTSNQPSYDFYKDINIIINVIEYSPFDYKLDLFLDSEEK